MSSSWRSRVRTPALVVGSLALVGAALWPLKGLVKEAGATDLNPSPDGPARLTAARWTNAAIPGTMRALMADALWLKAYAAWAVRDRLRTEALIHWVTMVDDRPLYFWINGARMIAYDIPEWRLSALEGGQVPFEVRRRVVEEQACAALRHLNAARICHPESAAIWVEMGNIHLYRRGDVTRAADCYRRAAESPDAPYYSARVYAELLRRLGRDREAYVWLCRLHPTLPGADQAAMSGLVLKRIRDLERRLEVPEGRRYVPISRPAADRNPQSSGG